MVFTPLQLNRHIHHEGFTERYYVYIDLLSKRTCVAQGFESQMRPLVSRVQCMLLVSGEFSCHWQLWPLWSLLLDSHCAACQRGVCVVRIHRWWRSSFGPDSQSQSMYGVRVTVTMVIVSLMSRSFV